MARLCPQCGEIHFETAANPLPAHCRKCNANLNEASGLMTGLPISDVGEEQTDAPKPPKRPFKQMMKQWSKVQGFKGIVVGIVVLLAAAVMLFLGYDWHTRVKQVDAFVHFTDKDTPKEAKRDKLTATYHIGTKKYYQYPGLRVEGASFPVYYLPEAPGNGYETKPFLWLIIGGLVAFVGMGILVFGVVKFCVGRALAADYVKTMAQAG